ncbi:MAG: ribbon-helix-helix protein, CopG family [Actinobacteria bacterium]|uniref:Unannotated protein n=1 Tax=freshwater metagenome TaxID=449393 RepID=A0A6J7L8T2_9ZZZZ|nr:ribbon-helix-helix protein, CopG family [Actinomycetota bacterium]
MRTTVTIDDALYRRVKAHAALSGLSVGSVMEEALRALLLEKSAPVATQGALPVFECGEFLLPVDASDTSALLDPLLVPAGLDERGSDAVR